MAYKLLFGQAEMDELRQQLYGSVARQAAEAGKAVEREWLFGLGKEPQDSLLVGSEGDQCAIVFVLLAPEGHLHGRGHDVLIGNAHEGAQAVVVEAGTHGTLVGRLHLGNHHTAPLYATYAHATRYRRHAVECCCGLDHVDLLIAAHTGYLAIVLHTNEQTAAVGIGKGREGARNLAHIGDLVLEILLLVFALGDEMVKQVLLIYNLRIYYLLFIYHFTI